VNSSFGDKAAHLLADCILIIDAI